MPKQWFVAQAIRNREIPAAMSVVAFGFEAYVPIVQRLKRVGRQVIQVPAPRFGTYIFVKFDRDVDDWGQIIHEPTHKRYFTRVLLNVNAKPALVPDKVMEAVKSYQPPEVVKPQAYRYSPGEACTVYIAGQRRQAVFVEYCGSRPFIRTWIFGAERISEVSSAELEPLTLDNINGLSPISAA